MTALEQVSLASIPAENGPYGVAASDVNDLGAYVRASTRTLGHFQGEGHCAITQWSPARKPHRRRGEAFAAPR